METMPLIRQHINQLTSLPSAARAVLIEVCELVENGGQGKCFAGNQHLADKASCHPVSVSRHLALLKSVGLIEVEFDGNDNSSRTIIPLPELVSAYTTGEVGGLNRVLRVSKQDVKTPISRVLKESKQGVNHTTVTTEGTTKDYLTTPNVALTTSACADRAAVENLEKEVAKLTNRLEKAKEAYRAQQAELQQVADRAVALAMENEKLTAQLVRREKRKALPVRRPIPDLAQWHPEQVAQMSEEQRALIFKFHAWASKEDLEQVFGLERPLTPQQVVTLVDKHGITCFKEILFEMESSKALVGKTAAYHVANTWIRNNVKREERREQRYSEQTRYSAANGGTFSRFNGTTPR